ncbi:MAG TPA: metal-dependent transcriptional regulator [Candidatus Hydrogenedentes bacterium]|nr:metal-dependent transcriptional regulator [Candidatus Hydrogenedentota bacterium]HOV76093.1 metal-dependent transcriptional regulator [Candidatus Hydrogenedentota bacterium]
MPDITLSESLEDYLETIVHVQQERDSVRSRDIASERGVSTASVTGALRALARRGLIDYEPYGTIMLTSEGRRLGRQILGRHNALRDFLENRLGIPRVKAAAAACRMEHAIPADIIGKMLALFDRMAQCPLAAPEGNETASRGKKTPACPLAGTWIARDANPGTCNEIRLEARKR